ncbi:MAG: ATP-binding protein [Solirubrobacterales bacterium]
MKYAPRIADAELKERLRYIGAVLVEGPKACGKTETARRIAKSEVRLDVDRRSREVAELDPRLILDGEPPRLLDEWQLVPEVWNHVRRAVDDRQQKGQFILAGSAQPTDDETHHTGAGRISRLTMRPMSLFELGISKGEISLSALLEGKAGSASDEKRELTDIAATVCRGGWPASKDLSLPDALKAVRDYLNEIPRDTRRLGQRHRPARVTRVIESLARNIATPVAARTLAKDSSQPEDPISEDVVADYLNSLGRLFVIENQPAWQPHLRSRYRLRQSVKRHFVDPSLAVAALRGTPESLMRDLNFLGLLFESMVVRDLRVYAQPLEGEVQYYQDNSGLEVDAIVDAGDSWGAFEVKLGGQKPVDEAAANLLKFSGRVDSSRTGPPAVLGVIVANGYGYVREDGVQVVPIACLGP